MTRASTFKTHIGLGADVRDPMIALLNQQLADSIDLYSQTKQAHWNIKGAQFFQLHLLFDKLAASIEGHVDLIAERAAALGGTALGTARMAASASRLPEYPDDAIDGRACVAALAARYALLGTSARDAVAQAAAAGDPGTADLCTQLSRELDLSLWFLEAHLQS